MRQAGIIGAGGGFRTYFKWAVPQPHLIVNATESEPGLLGDVAAIASTSRSSSRLRRLKAICSEQISLGVHEKDREPADYEHATASSTCATCRNTPQVARFRQDATGTRCPGCDTPDGMRRSAAGRRKVVNNSETLLNAQRALLGQALTTKRSSPFTAR